MLIDQKKTVQVDVKTMEICLKVSDRFSYELKDAQGDQVYSQGDGYVPSFMPGNHHGDYVMLTIDLETGHILNWKKPHPIDLTNAIRSQDDE